MLVKNRAEEEEGGYPPCPQRLPREVSSYGRYQVRFARRPQELEEILRLRFRIFNLELGEGLAESYRTGRDEDTFDRCCHHLLVEDRHSGTIVGTYRMQTADMARSAAGFYSAGEFELDSLPREVLHNSVEVGRTCIAREHRNRQVLFLLWRGLASYVREQGLRYLFGCCSVNSQDPREGEALLDQLQSSGYVHPTIAVTPEAGLGCSSNRKGEEGPKVTLPTLFRTYLRYGGQVCGPPAIDRAFRTIDFFLLFDVDALDRRRRTLFFGDLPRVTSAE